MGEVHAPFLWSITMSLDLEPAADAEPVQGELLDADASPPVPEPHRVRCRIRRRTARITEPRQPAGLCRPAEGASRARHRGPQAPPLPRPGRSRPRGRRAVDRPRRARRVRQRRDGLRQDHGGYRHRGRAARGGLSPNAGPIASALGLQVAPRNPRNRCGCQGLGAQRPGYAGQAHQAARATGRAARRPGVLRPGPGEGCGWASTGSQPSLPGVRATAT